MKLSKISCFAIAASLTWAAVSSTAYADSISLIDGSLLYGKIIEENQMFYVLANTFGTFQVKKKFVDKAYITDSYIEDIAISKKLDKKIDLEKIKKNYLAGLEKMGNKENTPLKKADEKNYWYFGRLTIYGTYFSTFLSDYLSILNVSNIIPGGIGAQIAYDQGLEMGLKKRNMAIPGLRFEFTYMFFGDKLIGANSKTMMVYSGSGGLLWAFPYITNKWGYFVLAAMAGVGYIEIENNERNESATSITPIITGLFGYEYQWNAFGICLHLRYTYIQDEDISFHGLGASLGFSFKLW